MWHYTHFLLVESPQEEGDKERIKKKKGKGTNNSNKLASSPALLKANSRIVRGLIGYH